MDDSDAANLAFNRLSQKCDKCFASFINTLAMQVKLGLNAPVPSAEFRNNLVAQFSAFPRQTFIGLQQQFNIDVIR